MRIVGERNNCQAWLSAKDTYNWAHRAGAAWPGSTLSNRRVYVEVSRGNLVGFALDGRDDDCDGCELSAMLSDLGIRD